MTRFAVTTLTALIVAACLAAPGEARFIVSPMELHLEVAGGTRGGEPVSVTNTGDEPISLKLYLADSRFLPDGSEWNVPVGGHARSCASWIALGEQSVSLAPGETREVTVVMEVPDEMRGSYWSKLYIEELSGPAPSTGTHNDRTYVIYARQRVGVRIFQDVPGTMNRSAKIDLVTVEGAAAGSAPAVNVRVSNTGNALLRCRGWVELRDSEGAAVETVFVGSEGRFALFPDGFRDLALQGEAPLAPGDYTALAIVDFGGDYLVAGDAFFEVPGSAPAPTAPVVASADRSDEAPADRASTVGEPSPAAGPDPVEETGPAPGRKSCGAYTVQLHVASSERGATTFIEKHGGSFREPFFIYRESPYFKVRGGCFSTLAEAGAFLGRAKAGGIDGAWIVPVALGAPEEGGAPAAAVAADESLPAPKPEPAPLGAPPAPAATPERTAGAPAEADASAWGMQLFATDDEAGARAFAKEFEKKTGEPARVIFEAPYHKVRIGRALDRAGAERLKQELARAGFANIWIVRPPGTARE
jgi:hypothetical protein